jgi:hypothetical protein
MKQHALLLSTPLVPPFIAGIKTNTRRIPGPTNSFVDGKRVSGKKWKEYQFDWASTRIIHGVFVVDSKETGQWHYVAPIYNPGDWLWFRETWAPYLRGTGNDGFTRLIKFKADGAEIIVPEGLYDWFDKVEGNGFNWRPSIHLPKEVTRLYAEVSTCTCEHVRDITEEQAIAEGVQPNCSGVQNCPSPYCKEKGCQAEGEYFHYLRSGDDFPVYSALESFESLWASIHGPESWPANPPVYAISYKILSTTGKPLEKENV